ncbi:hypothetical protein ABJI51_18155 [Amycolatopsis sp. NEAU-NG30]|uniref:Uncharacterized protein n=1 Tax=Amycolatopsis melonis TaxID=3156488 RepID=A0ABV0LFE5_9PSEU
MSEPAAPLMRLPDATRAAVHAVLLAELTAAGARARVAGWPPEVLAAVFDARRRVVVDGVA